MNRDFRNLSPRPLRHPIISAPYFRSIRTFFHSHHIFFISSPLLIEPPNNSTTHEPSINLTLKPPLHFTKIKRFNCTWRRCCIEWRRGRCCSTWGRFLLPTLPLAFSSAIWLILHSNNWELRCCRVPAMFPRCIDAWTISSCPTPTTTATWRKRRGICSKYFTPASPPSTKFNKRATYKSTSTAVCSPHSAHLWTRMVRSLLWMKRCGWIR